MTTIKTRDTFHSARRDLREQGEERKWHHRSERLHRDQSTDPRKPPHCVNDAKPKNAVEVPLNRSFSVPASMHVPYNLSPQDQTIDLAHTHPFFNTVFRTSMHPTRSLTNLPRHEGRIYKQGSFEQSFSPTHHTAIPRYTGHMRGTVAENIFAQREMLANENSNVAVQTRDMGDPSDYRQTTQALPKDQPSTWKKTAKKTWKQATHGMSHQPAPPFGNGDEYRERLLKEEREEKQKLYEDFKHSTENARTFAANQPQHVRDHHLWKTGICGYQGYRPYWQKEKDFFNRREVGKVHPPYCPETRNYSVFVQAPETPKVMKPIYRPDHVFHTR